MQIVIWDGATGAKVKELEGHSSYVKGIAWDPVGTYLASQVWPAMEQQQQQQQQQHHPNHVQCFVWTCVSRAMS
jgi:WD40 repeat protein